MIHARLQSFLTKKHNAPLVLASATPSVKSYYMAQKGEYKLLKLTKRATAGGQLANVHVVDMREELKAGNKNHFQQTAYRKSCRENCR